jgi:hypothetical protein
MMVTLMADAYQQLEYMQQRWPGQQFPPYSPSALIPQLDAIGREGWELVSIQPVIMGKNGDIAIGITGTSRGSAWTYQYLCTFKRRLPRA